MGIFDSILGRTRPPQADLDVLFAVPQAVLSMGTEGFSATGAGSVCFRDVEGGADDTVMADAEKLIATNAATTIDRSTDRFGFHWLTVTRTDQDVSGLVTDLHAVNSSWSMPASGRRCCARRSGSRHRTPSPWHWSISTNGARSIRSHRFPATSGTMHSSCGSAASSRRTCRSSPTSPSGSRSGALRVCPDPVAARCAIGWSGDVRRAVP